MYFRCSTYGSWLFYDTTAEAFRHGVEFPLPWEADTYYAAAA